MWYRARPWTIVIVTGRERELSGVLTRALGIDPQSFEQFLQWALAEHLASELGHEEVVCEQGFFARPDAMRAFRDVLRHRTGRRWSRHDIEVLFARVKADSAKHFREPVRYEEYLKLLWQVPMECAHCHRCPPDVELHIDHIVPSSKGGRSTRPNLQFLCRKDNLRKSDSREVAGPWLDLR